MRAYKTRRHSGAIPFEVDGVTFYAKPVLEMAARRDLTVIDFKIEGAWTELRKEQKARTATVVDGDVEAFDAVLGYLVEKEQEIRELIIEAAAIMIEEDNQEAFAKAALNDWDDLTLYEIFADLKKQSLTAEEVMSQEHPTKR